MARSSFPATFSESRTRGHFPEPLVIEESAAREEGDDASEARWENEGGKLERSPRRNEFSLELVKHRDGTEAILYVHRDSSFVKTVTGRYSSVRENARRDYVGARLHEIDLAA